MTNQPPNPYFNLAGIRNSEMFFGRTHLLRRFYEMVFNRQSVSLLGPSHIGKTSFLQCAASPQIQARFPFDLQHHIFVFFDLRKHLQRTCEDFFHSVSKAIIIQGMKAGLTLQAEGTGEDEFSSVLEQVAEQGWFPVLLLDAFDNVTRNKHFDPEFFSFLRSQASMGLVSYVTASVAPLYEVCHSGIVDSPFFNIFYSYTLEALMPEEARELITLPAERVDRSFTPAQVALVLKLAGRHPFFIQRVCHVLYEEKLQQGGGITDEQQLKNYAYQDLKPHFQSTWASLAEAQKELLQDEAQRRSNQPRKLPELSESALFRHFVRRTCQLALFSMTLEELEGALDKMSDPRTLVALGETNLRLLRPVAQRLTQDTLPSPVAKGIAVREVLTEAIEHLRGPGVPTNTAPEWKFYNILLYSYVKRYNLNNAQIAARLGVTSLRQFYRERKQATQALLNILFEMEHDAVNTYH